MLQHICGAREKPSDVLGVQPYPNMLSAINEVYKLYDGIVGEVQAVSSESDEKIRQQLRLMGYIE